MQLLCLSLVVVRCQPLRRALCAFLLNTPSLLIYPK
ncbi:disulfide bond formation protein DsbD, partial [Vibrio cholerae]